MAKFVGLKVKFVSYFGEDIHGRLLPREKCILINAHKPRCEHIFTLLHEIGHYLLHFLNPHRRHHPRFFDVHWKVKFLARVSSVVRRYNRRFFNRTSGKEWEADLYAFLLFLLLVKAIGCRTELLTFLDRHPEKFWTFLLAALAVTYGGIKTRIQKIPQTLLMPFRALRKP